jgi:CRISPR system Cascade subunit CasB
VPHRYTQRRQEDQELLARADALVAHIRKKVLRTPGTRAEVRRALTYRPGDPRTFAAFANVAPFLPRRPDNEVDEATEQAFLTVAAMMCAQSRQARDQDIAAGIIPSDEADQDDQDDQDNEDSDAADPPDAQNAPHDASTPRPRLSLGTTLLNAVNAKIVASDTAERRLLLVCRGNAAAALRQLPRVLAQIRQPEISVDWARLALDLARWDRHHDRIAATWLRDFYRPLKTLPVPEHNDIDSTTPEDIP